MSKVKAIEANGNLYPLLDEETYNDVVSQERRIDEVEEQLENIDTGIKLEPLINNEISNSYFAIGFTTGERNCAFDIIIKEDGKNALVKLLCAIATNGDFSVILADGMGGNNLNFIDIYFGQRGNDFYIVVSSKISGIKKAQVGIDLKSAEDLRLLVTTWDSPHSEHNPEVHDRTDEISINRKTEISTQSGLPEEVFRDEAEESDEFFFENESQTEVLNRQSTAKLLNIMQKGLYAIVLPAPNFNQETRDAYYAQDVGIQDREGIVRLTGKEVIGADSFGGKSIFMVTQPLEENTPVRIIARYIPHGLNEEKYINLYRDVEIYRIA